VGSTKQDQAARRKATQDVIAANRPLFEERMRHYYAEMGLGQWSRRPTQREREVLRAAEEKAKAAQKIKDIAEKAGLTVDIDGVAVEVDWRGDENGFADEQADVREALADTDDENYQSREAAVTE
jgi:hypothetical protein